MKAIDLAKLLLNNPDADVIVDGLDFFANQDAVYIGEVAAEVVEFRPENNQYFIGGWKE